MPFFYISFINKYNKTISIKEMVLFFCQNIQKGQQIAYKISSIFVKKQ